MQQRVFVQLEQVEVNFLLNPFKNFKNKKNNSKIESILFFHTFELAGAAVEYFKLLYSGYKEKFLIKTNKPLLSLTYP